MLEFSILAILATCIAGMIQVATSKREKLPVWERENGKNEIEKWLEGFLAKQGFKFWPKVDCESEIFFEKNAKRKRSEHQIYRFAFAIFRNKANSQCEFEALVRAFLK